MVTKREASEVLYVTLTPEQKASVQAKADAAGLTLSEFTKRALAAYEPLSESTRIDRLTARIDELEKRVDVFDPPKRAGIIPKFLKNR